MAALNARPFIAYTVDMRLVTTSALALLLLPAVLQAQCIDGHAMSVADLETVDFHDLRERGTSQLLEGAPRRLREIRFIRQNVFPDRNHWLAHQANRFNTRTRERTLVAAFPLNKGQPIDETLREEAERVLRRKPYLYDSLVLIRRICGSEVDLDVVVRDVWTLTPSIGFSRSGGDNRSNVALSDMNFLGSGKNIAIEYFDDRDRSGTSFRYDDPNLFGTRWAGGLVAADNDDGERYAAWLRRPFYAFNTRFAGGIEIDHVIRQDDLEFLGKDQYEIDAETDLANAFIAIGSGRREGWIRRYYLGAKHIDETFAYPQGFPDATTEDRTFTYPYLGWELIQDRFATRKNVDRVGVTEDLKLGWSSYVEVGWANDAWSGDEDHLLGNATLAYRRFLGERHVLGINGRVGGRRDLELDRSEDVRIDVELSYLWQQAPQWRFLTRFAHTRTKNLPLDKQLTLGGDSGLRGYPSRYQPGDRRSLLTLEQRYYSNAYPFGLARIGYAVFVDIGKAEFHDTPPAWVPEREGDHFGTLANVGFGLRLESIRTRRDRVIHIDFAKPLVDGPFVDSWEVTISGKPAF
jgi:hypothetical protein